MSIPDLLIPVRRKRELPGKFRWPEKAVLASPRSADMLPLQQLRGELATRLKVKAKVEQSGFGPATVRVRRDKRVTRAEGYRLVVWEGGIEVASRTATGAYYALQTLRELVRAHGASIPACEISDWPDFERRGVYMDCSRGKVPTVETLKEIVACLGFLKVNEFQLYIENVFTFQRHPAIGRGFSPFTPEELLAVQEECKRHHVRFVPSLTSFGHFERILGLPQYADLSELAGFRGLRGGTTLCPGDRRAFELIAQMYDEFLPLFEADDFNACCDETWELGQGRSKRRAERVGVGRVYLDFIKKLHRVTTKHGKRMNIWADIVLNHPEMIPEVPDDIVMLNWDYHPEGSRIPRTRVFGEAGLTCVVCPGTNGWGSHGTRLRQAVDNVAVFAKEGRRRGAEGLLNTDWGDTGHRNTLGVSLHGYAHGAAHAWHGRGVDDDRFTDVFCRQVLGTSDRTLPAFIRKVGASESTAGTSLYYSYHAPLAAKGALSRGISRTSPVWMPPIHRRLGAFDQASAEGCRRVIAALADTSAIAALAREVPSFGRGALRDMILAAKMDVLACRRILAGKALRDGKGLSREEVRALGSGHREVKRLFERAWLARNKPSRLKDNLRLFDNAIAEYSNPHYG